MDLTLDQTDLVKAIPRHALPEKHRAWTGNDESQRNHNGRIPAEETRVSIDLYWKAGKNAPVKPVGTFELDVRALAKAGYVAPDPAGGYRLKFLHAEDGAVYLGRGFTGKKIRIGKVLTGR